MTASEKEPLLAEKHTAVDDSASSPPATSDLESGPRSSLAASRTSKTGLLKRFENNYDSNPIVDSMTYDASVLLTWRMFFLSGVKCAWHKPLLWRMMGALFLVSLLSAVIVVVTISDPAQLKGSKFKEIGLFLRVFVGLLLGFFLTSSVSRWYNSVNGFMELFDAVRNMQMQLLALGVPDEHRFQCIRYGYISGWLLDKTLTIRLMHPKDRAEATDDMWKELSDHGLTSNTVLFQQNMREHVTTEEAALLKEAEDPAGMMWYWVASLVGRMAQDGHIPPMASPTYGRIMNLAQTAHGGIRHVKQSVQVQAPFIYVHMLASLVHVNNLICAISFGISLGSACSTMMIYYHQDYYVLPHVDLVRTTWKDVVADGENLIVMLFIGVFGPFLYQCLLEVSIEIAQPFANPECGIPTDRFLKMLKTDLTDAQELLKSPPGWEPPCFKPPAAQK